MGDSVYAVATPNTGYRFLGWSIPGLNNMNTDNPIRMMIPAEAANLTIPVTANFVPMGDDTYTVIATPVTTDGDINAGGTITGNGTYPAGSNVTLTAMADEGYRFVGWYSTNDSTFDMPISTEYSYSFVIMDNVSLLALFTPESNPTAVISIATADSTMGYVLLNNDTILRYIGQIGEEVTIEAIAYEGYRFVAWSDGDTNALRTIILDMPVTMLTARFELIPNSIDDAEEAEEIVIYTENDRITVRGAENRPVYVFDVVGRLVAKSAKASAEETFRMTNTGIYMVKVGNAPARRVVVRR
ncbi:MAG: InlB B-repeat-containing protein [Bacteroidales bacterium]|nr:InlB B-repeat-containing protein [Bacteroidales bacterium]